MWPRCIVAGVDSSRTAAERPRRGRPPIPEHRAAILEATRELLAEGGYAGLTFEAVAARAGLYRRYINRTWTSKAELVRDAALSDIPSFAVPDTGDFVSDIEAYVGLYVDLNLRPEVLWGLPSLQVELINDAALLEDTFERFVAPAVDALRTVLDRGVASKVLVEAPDAELLMSVLAGSIQQLALRGVLDREALVDYMTQLLCHGLLRVEA